MTVTPQILVVDDDPGTRKVAAANLGMEGFDIVLASCAEEALERLETCDPLAMVSDLKMPDTDGITLMERVHERLPSLPVVLVTAHATVETAVRAMRRGAMHYLTKPVRYDELAGLLRHAVAAERSRRDVISLRGELERVAGFEELVGTSPPMTRICSLVNQVAGTDATVLVHGETGTGKELVARAVHRRSPRAQRRFVCVNCTAIPRELAESEFFGHERGAFTGATQRRAGYFEQAHCSTLFLDEVGDLDPAMQGKLLRILQEGEFARVGGSAPISVDVRLVAASNRDLEAAVASGAFRQDLFYRLNVIPITLPPLRERAADIPLLLDHFLRSFVARYGRQLDPPPASLLAAAEAYGWPGNVRELRNLCERAVLMGWAAVEPILTHPRRAESGDELIDYEAPFKEAKRAVVDRFERRYLRRLLMRHHGRIGAAARAAGMAERNLYDKLRLYGLRREEYQ